jgi:hypothetical protein
LPEEKRQKLVKYWGNEKVRRESELTEKLENQTERGSSFYKEIREVMNISAFHEERGLKGCKCYSCREAKEEAEAEIGSFSDKKLKKTKEKD